MKRLAHKTLLLSTAILLILLALPVTALANGGEGENEFTQTVNGFQVTLVFDKPATVGENQIHIRLNDTQNMPISNADVEVSVVNNETEHTAAEANSSAPGAMAGMPGMDGMPGMSEQSAQAPIQTHDAMGMTALAAGHASGEYTGNIAIEIAGDSLIRVHLTIQGELTEVDFPLNVTQPKNGSGILTGFLTLNVAIIAAAVILKPKPLSKTLSEKA